LDLFSTLPGLRHRSMHGGTPESLS
jgi:hypothetical protein